VQFAWWTIAKLELTLAIRDRGSLIWSLIAPVAMAWIFGTMFGGGPESPVTHAAIDAGANPPAVARGLADALESDGSVVVDSVATKGGVRVELPDSLLAALRAGGNVVARVHKGDAGDLRSQAVGAKTREALYRMAFQRERLERAASLDVGDHPLAMSVAARGTAPRVATGAQRTLPAMLVMFIMFQLTTFFLTLWVADLQSGKTRRITMSPTRTGDILVAQIVARLIWGAIQVAIILGMGSLILGVHLDVQPVQLAAVLGAYMLAAASLGMLLASFFRSTDKANAVGVIVSLVMAALGGCWWPLEIAPAAMRKLALVFPTGETMDALGGMTAIGPHAPFPTSNVLILLAMACIMMPIAARRMKSQLAG
jgi:ABC-type Na+ efflux pump permease subunit